MHLGSVSKSFKSFLDQDSWKVIFLLQIWLASPRKLELLSYRKKETIWMKIPVQLALIKPCSSKTCWQNRERSRWETWDFGLGCKAFCAVHFAHQDYALYIEQRSRYQEMEHLNIPRKSSTPEYICTHQAVKRVKVLQKVWLQSRERESNDLSWKTKVFVVVAKRNLFVLSWKVRCVCSSWLFLCQGRSSLDFL